jgi:hypothetical protein
MVKLSSLAIQIVKTMALFSSGLYLLGFGLFESPNAKGVVDFLLPFEWVGCFAVGVLFLSWSLFSYANIWRLMRK